MLTNVIDLETWKALNKIKLPTKKYTKLAVVIKFPTNLDRQKAPAKKAA